MSEDKSRLWKISDAISENSPFEHDQGDVVFVEYDELVDLKQERDKIDSTLSMAVARLGGIVEGRPTSRANFLQRIDGLVEVERRYIALREECDLRDATTTHEVDFCIPGGMGWCRVHPLCETNKPKVREIEDKLDGFHTIVNEINLEAVGRALNVPLGQSIPANILPGIERMLTERAAVSEIIQNLKDLKPILEKYTTIYPKSGVPEIRVFKKIYKAIEAYEEVLAKEKSVGTER
jgi:hypothetical protein